MPVAKRALQELSQPVGKRRRLSDSELEELSKNELVQQLRGLEAEVERLERALTLATSATASTTSNLTEFQAKEKAESARKSILKGVKKQMVWKPSCKSSSAKFSFSSQLHSKQVFDVLTNQPADAKKPKKQLSFTPDEFQDDVLRDRVDASARYSNLYITGKSVTMRWNEDDQEVTVSGSYGTG